MKDRYTIYLLGKLPPPFMGPSVAFSILVNSRLKDYFHLHYLDTRVNLSLNTLGKWSINKLLLNLKIYSRYSRDLKQLKPDLILVPLSQSLAGFIKDSVFLWLAKWNGIKPIVQLRGGNFKYWVNSSGWFTRWYVKKVLSISSDVLVLGKSLRYMFTDYFPEERIHVIPNGGDFHSDCKKNESPVVRIAYSGNLQPSKGIEDVIRALIILKSKLTGFSVHLDVMGTWRDEVTKSRCISLVKEFDLPVFFFNQISGQELLDNLFRSDIFVFTPREQEGHPWVIIEAMAAGLPIVATPMGAIAESVEEGVNGFLVSPSQPEMIAQRLERLISDPQCRLDMGTKSRLRYEDLFTEEKMINRYRDTFNQIITGSQGLN
jgi:glycosyltransferase involved in cell wall biosynthesis